MPKQESLPFLTMDVEYTDMVVVTNDFEDNLTYSLSDFGQKIFFEVLSRVNSRESHENQIITITAAELEKAGLGFSRGMIYKHFAKACQEVRDMKVWLLSADSENDYATNLSVFTGSHHVYKREKKGRKLLESHFVLNEKIAPYLTQITTEMMFAQFLVEQTRKMRKAFSSRLYQWARRHHWLTISRPLTSITIGVERLKTKLCFTEDLEIKRSWGDFKRRILDVAVEEVNSFSDLHISYTLLKKGKGGRVTAINFSIKNALMFEVVDNPEAKALEGLLLEADTPSLDAGLAALIKSQFPEADEFLLSTLALIPKEVVVESLLTYGRVAAGKGKTIEKPFEYFMKIVSGMQKEEARLERESGERYESDPEWYKDSDFSDV